MKSVVINNSQKEYFRKWLSDTYNIVDIIDFMHLLPYLYKHHSEALVHILYQSIL